MTEAAASVEFYPELRADYSNKIGTWGEQLIREVLEDYDDIPLHLLNEGGVDIEMPHFDIGVEIWNHRGQHAYSERLKSVIRNLSGYKYKFHVASYISPEYKNVLEREGIHVIELGHQTIASEYIPFYLQYHSLKGKKTLNRRTLKITRNRLAPIFETVKKEKLYRSIEQLKSMEFLGVTEYSVYHSHVCNNSNNKQQEYQYTSNTYPVKLERA